MEIDGDARTWSVILSHARWAASRNGYTIRERCQIIRAFVGFGCHTCDHAAKQSE